MKIRENRTLSSGEISNFVMISKLSYYIISFLYVYCMISLFSSNTLWYTYLIIFMFSVIIWFSCLEIETINLFNSSMNRFKFSSWRQKIAMILEILVIVFTCRLFMAKIWQILSTDLLFSMILHWVLWPSSPSFSSLLANLVIFRRITTNSSIWLLLFLMT